MRNPRHVAVATLVCLFTAIVSTFAQNWTMSGAPMTNWVGVAGSADGSKVVGIVEGGGIYNSVDAGVTWTLTKAPQTNWASVAISALGSSLFAGVNGGLIYRSLDSAQTWEPAAVPVMDWQSLACSGDGTKVVAAGSGAVFTSADSGATRKGLSLRNRRLQSACPRK